ncbi:MAG: MBL fold metallo-hydrolase [Gammaproteobacteria bacterium]|nr:MBL fold metallo-hydrolase [Gammaproteobacteria bacterium]
MPLGGTLAHINIWAIEVEDGWAIVDTGLYTEATIAVWERLLIEGLRNKPVKAIYVTHMHPDHVGMAGWLQRRFGCRFHMTALEYMNCRVLTNDTGKEAPDAAITFYRSAGWDEDAIANYRKRFGGFGRVISEPPESYFRLRDEMSLQIGTHSWTVLIGSGHSPEHACLYSSELGLLISGDQVLPRISSNVSIYPTEPEANPLDDWLKSLTKVKEIVPDNVLVLPSHNEPFYGLHARIETLVDGHLTSLNHLQDILQQRQRAIDVFPALFHRKIGIDPVTLSLATGEALAHINYLIAKSLVTIEVDTDDIKWYSAMTS